MKWVYSGYSTATPSSSNLIKKYDYVYSSSTEGMAWKDLLTEYDGEAIVYDNIGNPTTYRGSSLLWNGRELVGFFTSDGGAMYLYDASGLRTTKLRNGEFYYYYYVEGKLMSESCSMYDLFYTYDSLGNLSGIKKVDANGTTTNYGVQSNIFGDVLGIFDASGNLVAKYSYDSWGKLLSITNASGTDISSTDGIWLQNSIRYRGYVYDNESGWYYLQSRYYDPEICRFINADTLLTNNAFANVNDFCGYNVFAYCCCNPLLYFDYMGMLTVSIGFNAGAVFGLGISAGIFASFDDHGNIAIQWDYSLPTSPNITSAGTIGAGISAYASITDLDNIYELEGAAETLGICIPIYGPFSLLIDGVVSPITNQDFNGLKIGITLSPISIPDVHISRSTTQTWKSNSFYKKIEKTYGRIFDNLEKIF